MTIRVVLLATLLCGLNAWSLPSTNRKVVLRIDAELLDKDNNVLKKNELPTAPKLDNNNE